MFSFVSIKLKKHSNQPHEILFSYNSARQLIKQSLLRNVRHQRIISILGKLSPFLMLSFQNGFYVAIFCCIKYEKCLNYPGTIHSRERKKCIFSLLCKCTFSCVRHLSTFLSHYFTFYQRFRLVKTVLLGQYSAIVLSYMLC